MSKAPKAAAPIEAAAPVASLPAFTVRLIEAMKAKDIPRDPAEIIKGLASVGVEISPDAASRHLTGDNFKGRADTRFRVGYRDWLGVDPGAGDDRTDAVVDSLIGEAESAALRPPKEAHADLDALLRSENGGLAKYVLRRLRQLTPTRP